MQKVFFSLFILGLFSFHNPQPKVKLTLEIKGINQSTGKLCLAAFRKTDNFPEVGGEFKNMVVYAKAPSTEVVIELPSDTYAIAVFHDVNNSGRIDKNRLGIPTENYGFSNNARETFSAPSFQSAAFHLKNDMKMVIWIK